MNIWFLRPIIYMSSFIMKLDMEKNSPAPRKTLFYHGRIAGGGLIFSSIHVFLMVIQGLWRGFSFRIMRMANRSPLLKPKRGSGKKDSGNLLKGRSAI